MDGRIGDELRQERRARGIGLEDVEAATGVRTRFLRAIEEEDWDRLPGDFYARAFTRTYANYLGLDPAELALERRLDPVGDPDAAGPRVEPRQVPESPSARKPRPRWPLAAAGALLLAAAVVALVAALGGGGSTRSAPPGPGAGAGAKSGGGGGGKQGGGAPHQAKQPAGRPGTSLRLTATGEVWVCLLDGAGKPLIDGQIMPAGSEAGPFRSRRYQMSFGNGEVELTLDGAPARTPASASPIGFAVDSGGDLKRIPEGERPECA